jgi:hypothetical protein
MAMFDMKDYVSVAERVQKASPLIKSVISADPIMMSDVLGYVRVTVTLTDGREASAMASFRLDAQKGAQKTNPLEDAETSALGRVLAFLGYATSKSLASREEMQEAVRRDSEPDVQTRIKTQNRVVELANECVNAGLKIDHNLASLQAHEMTYEELVAFGKYLKALLG